MTRDEYVESLIPHATRLAGVVRDEGPEAVRAVLATVRRAPRPDGIDPMDAFAVVLAAMVPEWSTPRQLLAWTQRMAGAA